MKYWYQIRCLSIWWRVSLWYQEGWSAQSRRYHRLVFSQDSTPHSWFSTGHHIFLSPAWYRSWTDTLILVLADKPEFQELKRLLENESSKGTRSPRYIHKSSSRDLGWFPFWTKNSRRCRHSLRDQCEECCSLSWECHSRSRQFHSPSSSKGSISSTRDVEVNLRSSKK